VCACTQAEEDARNAALERQRLRQEALALEAAMAEKKGGGKKKAAEA
jgi:hypothetical protein